MNRQLIFSLVFGALVFSTFSDAWGITRGRVQVRDNTVVTDQGTLLRSVDFDIWKYLPLQTDFTKDPASYLKMRALGYNCIRIPCIFYEMENSGFTYYTIAETVALLDIAVDNAEAAGMYVCIDYHDCGTYDLKHLEAFWSTVAPRYADRTHVFYEMANEPVAWDPTDYTSFQLNDFTHLYNLIRSYAPDTHIVLLSFAVAGEGMSAVADQLDGIDWSNASVGFHPYWITSSRGIKSLKDNYPVIATEFSTPDFNDTAMDASGVDGERWLVKVMEELGISWMLWNMGVHEDNLWIVENQITDARNRGYMWVPDDFSSDGLEGVHMTIRNAVLERSQDQNDESSITAADFITDYAAIVPSSPNPLTIEALTLADIGNPEIPTTLSINGNSFIMQAAGADIWNQRDQFGMAYATISGDCEIMARVLTVEDTNMWAKAGVMIRDSLEDGCKYATTVVTPTSGIMFQRRLVEGDFSSATLISGVAPVYVKLIRRGNLFSSLYSSDGQNWSEIGSQIISMNDSIYIGLCVTSHNDDVSCEVEFDSFQITSR